MARIGYGVTATLGGTALTDLVSIGMPGAETNAVDVTNLGQAGTYRQFIAGMTDGGTLTFGIQWGSSSYATLVGYQGTLKTAVIDCGTPVYTYTDALVTKVGDMPIELEDVMVYMVECKINGAVAIS